MQEQFTQDLEQEKRLKDNLAKIKNKIMIISGKGGVGKTTIAVNLAYGLASKGKKTGILDVDIHGPNVAKMLGVEDKKLKGSESGIEPVEVSANLKVVSLAFMLKDPDQPVIWRGPLKMVTIKQFLADVKWGELDYLIVDAPPGTGDEPLSVCQIIQDLKGAVIVTTPQDVAILDSRKSISFARQINVPILGIVENMSGFICPECGKEVDLFGKGGGEKAALEMNVPFLGSIPVESDIVKKGDAGQPYICSKEGTVTAKIMDEIIEKIIE